MPKNIKDILLDATKYPAAIEAKLPAGAPKVSTMLVDAAGKIPAIPDFPMDVPALPAPPELPAMPTMPTGLRAPEFLRTVEVVKIPTRIETGAPAVSRGAEQEVVRIITP